MSETRTRVKITPRENWPASRLSSRGVIFTRARVSLAPDTIYEEKWGTTRSLREGRQRHLPSFLSYFKTPSIDPDPGMEPVTSRSDESQGLDNYTD